MSAWLGVVCGHQNVIAFEVRDVVGLIGAATALEDGGAAAPEGCGRM